MQTLIVNTQDNSAALIFNGCIIMTHDQDSVFSREDLVNAASRMTLAIGKDIVENLDIETEGDWNWDEVIESLHKQRLIEQTLTDKPYCNPKISPCASRCTPFSS